MKVSNEKVIQHEWLKDMRQDEYFPNFLVDKVQNILIKTCKVIEKKKPDNLSSLYKITNDAVGEINELQQEFYQQGCSIETMARECILNEFMFISGIYDFPSANLSQLTQDRNW